MSEQTFGRYSLLRQLGSDALGTIYRAGLLEEGGVAELVLLRIFDAPEAQSAAVADALARAQPGVGTAAVPAATDCGTIDNRPFMAYPYVSGRTVRRLIEDLANRGASMPAEHSLFLIDRVTQAAEAFANSANTSGIVLAETAYLSNDGDIQLLGREVAGEPLSVLARETGLTNYLANDDRLSDIHSISVLLGEMMGNTVPEDIQGLIDAGTADKPPSLEAWKGRLEQVRFARAESSTAFDLAFFVHGLLIDEIEEDTRRIEAEKTSLGADPEPEEEPTKKAAPTVASTPTAKSEAPETAKDSRKLSPAILAAAGIAALALVGWLGWQFLGGDSTSTAQTPTETRDVTTDVALPAANPVDASADEDGFTESTEGAGNTAAGSLQAQPAAQTALGAVDTTLPAQNPLAQNPPTQSPLTNSGVVQVATSTRFTPAATDVTSDLDVPEPPQSETEIREQIQAMAAAKSAEVEESLRAEYQEQFDALRKQLEEAEAKKKADEEAQIAAQKAEEERKRQEQEAKALAEAEAKKRAEEEAARKAAEEAAKAKPGDLVADGPGVTTAKMTKQPRAVYPRVAERMGRSATINVRVLVDETGKVTDAQLIGDKASFGFDEAALAAARATEWQPAQKDGVKVKMWKVIRIVFEPR